MTAYILYIISLALGSAGAMTIRLAGRHWGLVDNPNVRSSHVIPTPKGGGIGILAAFIVVIVWGNIPFQFWAPVAVLAFVSLIGDKYNLSVGLRLAVQLGAAIIVIWSGTLADEVGLLPLHLNKYYLVPGIGFFVIYVAATANIFNFMDGINGIAAITGIVAFALLAWYTSNMESGSTSMIMCLCLAFACVGFLPFNMPKAKVFMGDVGSILLGFVFAAMAVFWADEPAEFLALAACLFPFYADEFITMFIRIKDGERLSVPHRRHVYQLLANEMGVAHWIISLGYGVFQLVVGYSAIALIGYGLMSVLGLLAVYFFGFVAFSFQIRRLAFNKLR